MKPDKKQQYHLEPPKGLMNDPNGLVWFRDRYYVFFQWNRYKKDHSHKEWGMFCSENLTDWEFLGGAIQPGDTYDCSGVHSGSCLEIDGKLCAFYTGSRKDSEGKRSSSQCLAVSEDGLHFEKKAWCSLLPGALPSISEIQRFFGPGKTVITWFWGDSRRMEREL